MTEQGSNPAVGNDQEMRARNGVSRGQARGPMHGAKDRPSCEGKENMSRGER